MGRGTQGSRYSNVNVSPQKHLLFKGPGRKLPGEMTAAQMSQSIPGQPRCLNGRQEKARKLLNFNFLFGQCGKLQVTMQSPFGQHDKLQVSAELISRGDHAEFISRGSSATTTPAVLFDSFNGDGGNTESGFGDEEDDDDEVVDSSQQASRETRFPNSQELFLTWTWSQYPLNPPKAASGTRQGEKGPLELKLPQTVLACSSGQHSLPA
ncbi:hypothetical protein UY3_18792 [Chelonia mydas]|uniref:Uncharacterized protein n=1 Tax=Chelonia mydas TaxID=8469 RepID=M7AN51_CHEMY|nr:hypothetical protein UY3_18792 [Chelonia mydas]